MATARYKPNADNGPNEWTKVGTGTNHYEFVDDSTTVGGDDGTTTALKRSGGGSTTASEEFGFTHSIPAGATINSVKLYWEWKQTDVSESPNFQPLLNRNGTLGYGTAINAATDDTFESKNETIARPGGGSWAYSDLATLDFGFRNTTLGNLKNGPNDAYVSQIFIEIDYTESGHPAPTGLQVDGSASQTSAGDPPHFTAIFNDTASQTNKAREYDLQVDDNSDFSSPIWSVTNQKLDRIFETRKSYANTGSQLPTSGGTYTGTADARFEIEIDGNGTPDTFKWRKDGGAYTTGVGITGAAQTLSDGVTITFAGTTGHTIGDKWWINVDYDAPSDGQRCRPIPYGGTSLQSGVTYYWRIKFHDDQVTPVSSSWSAGNSFSGFVRKWADARFNRRRRLKFNSTHNASPAGLVASCNYQTGENVKVNSEGYFNEPGMGDFTRTVLVHKGRTHIFGLGKYEPSGGIGALTEDTITINRTTGEVGSVVQASSAHSKSDSHFSLAMTPDGNDYLHILYGAHNSTFYHRKSTQPNDFGSLSTDTGAWGSENTLIGVVGTYPHGFTTSDGTVFFFFRGNPKYESEFIFSTDGGSSWNGPFHYLYDSNTADRSFLYTHALRFDDIKERVWVGYSFARNNQPENGVSTIVGVCYSDYDSGGTNRFDDWYELDGATTGSFTSAADGGAGFTEITDTAHGLSDGDEIEITNSTVSAYNGTWKISTVTANTFEIPVTFSATATGDWKRAAKKIGISSTTVSSSVADDTKITPIWKNTDPGGEVEAHFAEEIIHFKDINRWPLVMTVTVFRAADAQEWAGVSMWKFNGSGWTRINITEDSEFLMRVGRAGFKIHNNTDGDLIALTQRDQKIPQFHQPTADVVSLNVTRSAGANNYALLDDGIIICDEDTTYIEGGATLDASFTSSISLPSDANKVYRVAVYAVCRRTTTTDGKIKLKIKTGGTEYFSPQLTVGAITGRGDVYQRFEEEWLKNPNTSAEWTISDVNALEFGIIGDTGSGTFRCTQIYLRADYITGPDLKVGAADVWRGVSTDGGSTWTFEPVMQNTKQGFPMVSSPMVLSHRTPEFSIGNGFDWFYFQDNKPFIHALPDARDVRVYRQGSVTSEIDRIIDYPRLNPSEITLKIPFATNANEVYGSDDLLIYDTDPNATDQPLGDPDNLYDYQQDFELVDDEANVDTITNWAKETGTFDAIIYETPPTPGDADATGAQVRHTNKNWAGRKTLRLNKTGVDQPNVRYDAGTDLTDKYVEVACGHLTNSTAAYAALIVKDVTAGTEFGVRIGPTTQFEIQYYDTAAALWKGTGTFLGGDGVVWAEFKIHVGGNGCSAWANGNLVVRELFGTPTVFDDVFLRAGTTAYFDNLRISPSVDESTKTTITTGFTDATMIYAVPANNTDTYTAADDAKHENISGFRFDIDLTAQWGGGGTENFSAFVRICTGSTWNAANVIGSAVEVKFTGVGSTETAVQTVSFTAPTITEGVHSIKIDVSDATGFSAPSPDPASNAVVNLKEIRHYTSPTLPVVSLEPFEYRGATFGYTVGGEGGDTATVGYSVSGIQFGILRSAPVEYLSGQASRSDLPAENLSGHKSGASLPIVYSGFLSVRSDLPAENLGATSYRVDMPVGYSGFVAMRSDIPAEISKILDSARADIPVEYSLSTNIRSIVPIEAAHGISQRVSAPVDTRQSIEVRTSLPVGFLAVMDGVRAALPVDFGLSLNKRSALPVEFLSGQKLTGALPVEYLGALALTIRSDLPVEYQTGFKSQVNVPVEHGFQMSGRFRLPLGYKFGLATRIDAPVEYRGSLKFGLSGGLPVGYLAGLAMSGDLPIDLGLSINSRSALPVDFKTGMKLASDLPVEWGGGAVLRIGGKLPIDYSAGLKFAQDIPVESLHSFAKRDSLPLEFGISVTGTANLPVEQLLAISSAAKIVAEYATGSAARFSLAVETKSGQAVKILANVEFGTDVKATLTLPVEELFASALRAKLPLETSGAAIAALIIEGAEILCPSFASQELLTATADAPELLRPSAKDKELLTPEADTPELLDPDADDHKIEGF